MITPSPLTPVTHSNSGFPEVEFGRNGDGYLVARVGDAAFAMLPGRDARHYLATGWRINRPIAEWKRSDFYGHSGELADEAAFRTKVVENAEHQRDKRALGRRDTGSNANTPWGPSQGATVYAEGVVCHSTAGHGGFHLSAERNRKVDLYCARRAAGTRKTMPGRSWRSPSRICSPATSGAAPSARSRIAGPMRGR